MSEQKETISIQAVEKIVNALKSVSQEINVSPLHGSSRAIVVSEIKKLSRQVIVLVPEIKVVDETFVELSLINPKQNLIVIKDFDLESVQGKLSDILKSEDFILISTYQLLNLGLPTKEKINKTSTKITVGGEITYTELIEYLNLINYTRDKFVEAPGYFSVRGSIIDFWSYSEKNPTRLEFDGDFIESIRYFDPESQRSTAKIEETTLSASINDIKDEEFTTIFSYLNNPLVFATEQDLSNLNKAVEKFITVEEYSDDIDFDDELSEIKSSEQKEHLNVDNTYHKVKFELQNTSAKWIIEKNFSSPERIELGIIPAPSIHSNFELLFNTIKEFSNKKFNVIVTSENELQTERLKDLFIEYNEELSLLIEKKDVEIITLPIKEGFISAEDKILVLTDYQIFNKPYRTKIPSVKRIKKSKAATLGSIKKGDFVVHEDYGIGKYAGLETIKIGDAQQESMKILYAEGGVVYVNLNYLSLVKKYSAGDSEGKLQPTLSKLGTPEWQNTKARAKRKIKEAARELIELYARRKASKGFSFSDDTIWQKELEASFFYEDTPDQARATEEIKQDMQSENPMDRLVCGDVGFGKTEVAVRAAFKAVQDGKQVAVLVPTTILAEQHFNTFSDRLSQFPVRIAVLSRFQSKAKQKEIVQLLEEGKIDIIIGTHRLLSKDVKFKDLGLLIIDEEHRFGVTAKEKLRQIRVNIDTLTLTATPIPRTLNLSLLGARDLSIIATPPPNRQPIYTSVSVFNIQKIREWILREVSRNGQVYFVHDRVQSIGKLAEYLQRNIPEIKIGIAHGQLTPSKLEEVIHNFLNKKFDVLISTKIIESGIDIPNVNTIIVNRADRFGLAELHQLRGRVGRSDRQAYAYFIVPSLTGITKKALRRLQAIEEFTEIGSGFNLSMRDLEIRGAGNLLGKEQTGFIDEIGFDLYIKLINEAVEELKYEEFKEVFKSLPKPKERTEPTIDTYFEIGIPEEYMPDQSERLNFYTTLYSVQSQQEIDDLKEEMTDRFGDYPEIVNRLIKTATLRFYASYALFDWIVIQRKNISIILPKGDKEDYYEVRFIELMRFILDEYKNEYKFVQQKDVMKLVKENKSVKPEDVLNELIDFSKRVIKLFGNEIGEEVSNSVYEK
ncbi:Transcription-repair coupling factor [Ignavibacterium album JCM 16511]|uniref:Transcription-repair-coupling factor n=1 Tax=Ignavibacterium album (strain DSM 19864 / JCM 16511 / NBRC 101810 / Mat9-16) TaxID=945713 RepID=I0AFH2_IGNAJ|nr:transcription-repair coupling factor [Ignavibacterium album]AFH47729.1 Transcription-repair coupling factor [Ignavibacterium album JCM 16511]